MHVYGFVCRYGISFTYARLCVFIFNVNLTFFFSKLHVCTLCAWWTHQYGVFQTILIIFPNLSCNYKASFISIKFSSGCVALLVLALITITLVQKLYDLLDCGLVGIN